MVLSVGILNPATEIFEREDMSQGIDDSSWESKNKQNDNSINLLYNLKNRRKWIGDHGHDFLKTGELVYHIKFMYHFTIPCASLMFCHGENVENP